MSRTSHSLLVAENLDVRYGQFRALFNVSLDLPSGHLMALLGPNGAGKSTLGRALSGLVPVTSGRVLFDGDDITRSPTHHRRRAGIAYIPEGRGIFPGLSVIENLKMAVQHGGRRSLREEAISRAIEVFPVLARRPKQRAGSLSGGEQQMLALARGLALAPRVIIADEMSLGLAPLVVDDVFAVLERARRYGLSVLLIEQFVHRALSLADDCLILARGEACWRGPAIEAGQEVLERYLGATAEESLLGN